MRTPDQILIDTNAAIEKAFEQVRSPKNTKILAESMAKSIQVRTRTGFGVDGPGGKQFRFKPLADSYWRQRKGEILFFTNKQKKKYAITKENNPELFSDYRASLDGTTTAKKSNLTATGYLLRSISSRGELGRMIVFIIDRAYGSNIFGKRPKKPIGTRTVAAYVEKIRPFFNLSKPQQNLLYRKIAAQIRTITEKLLGA